MPWLFLILGTFTVVAVAVASSKSSAPAPNELPTVSSLAVSSWESPRTARSEGAAAIPADKFNTHAQKFIDPYGIAHGIGGYSDVMSLPSDGKARMGFIHAKSQSTIPKPVPAADMLLSAASNLGIQATEKTKQSLIQQRDMWIDKIRQYGRMTANGYVVAFTELLGVLMRALPMEWTSVYNRAKSIAEDSATILTRSLAASIAYGAPYPMHVLDDELASLDDLNGRKMRVVLNLGQFANLPDAAKDVIAAWFALLVVNTDRDDVQRAIIATDATEWGKANMASDDQVYLAATVFATALNEPILPFAIELWNRSAGWSRWKGLATNINLAPPISQTDGGVITYGQKSGKLGYWYSPDPDPDTGYRWAFDSISNARMLNWLDILLTGWIMVGERKGQSPINKTPIKLAPITLGELPAPPTPKG